MKINKLITLSEFVKRLAEYHDERNGAYMIDSMKWYYTKKYNEFLQQPLKKEMFVNEISKPEQEELKGDSLSYNDQYKECEEAEKKVIFEGFKKSQYYAYNFHNDKIRINFSNADYIRYELMFVPCDDEIIKTISDLAEKTNGTLTLKNVEI